jgi:hypothetical protein
MPRYEEFDDWEDRFDVRARRRSEDDDDDSGFYRRELPHSGPGIASFILGLLSGLAVLFVLILAGVLTARAGGELDEESPEAMLVGGALLVCLLGALVGAILGGVGLAQQRRKKIFAILGLCFNLLVLLGTGAIIVLGILLS